MFAPTEKAIPYLYKTSLKRYKAMFFKKNKFFSTKKRGNIPPKSFLVFLNFGRILPLILPKIK